MILLQIVSYSYKQGTKEHGMTGDGQEAAKRVRPIGEGFNGNV